MVRNFVWVCIIMVLIVICLLMGLNNLNLKQKIQALQEIHSLGNIWKDWGATNKKKTWLFGYVYDFSVDYGIANMLDIVSVHKYLIIKNNIV